MSKDNTGWMQYLRLVTPFLLILIGLYTNGIRGDLSRIDIKLSDIDSKLFRHLTNDDIHTPKDIVITRAEFKIYQEMRERQMCTLEEIIRELNNTLKEKGFRR